MATQLVVSCDLDGCDKKKGDVNHWFKVWIRHGTFSCVSASQFADGSADYTLDVCGAEHAMVLFNRYLSHGTFEISVPMPDPNAL